MQLYKRSILIFMLMAGWVLAGQNGAVSGRIIDEKSGDALMGANVVVEGTGQGAASDLDGGYMIYNVAPGIYTLRVSYIGYETKVVRDVNVEDGRTATLNLTVSPVSLEMGSVIVEVRANKSSDAFLITRQKKSANVQDGISSSQISKNGDSNAAEAAKRISGVTIMDDKYVYVRGLGERYTTTEMNGAPMPSPEPDKRTVPLNMFPSALLESITAMKTYTPDLPGTFAGGNVNIQTKAYPDERILKISASAGEKTYPRSGQTFYRLQEGRGSYFGFNQFNLPDDVAADRRDGRRHPPDVGAARNVHARGVVVDKDVILDDQRGGASLCTDGVAPPPAVVKIALFEHVVGHDVLAGRKHVQVRCTAADVPHRNRPGTADVVADKSDES